MGDGGADLRLDIITDNGYPGVGELLGPHRVGGDEHRQRVDERHPGVDSTLGVELVGFLRAHRQIGDQHVDLGLLERLDDVDGLRVGEFDGVGVVLADAIEGRPALHDHVGRRHIGDLDGVVLRGEDGVGQVEADLLGVHVERRHELDVANVVRAEPHVHEARYGRCVVGVVVVLDALDQRGRAVADADNGDSNLRRRLRRR